MIIKTIDFVIGLFRAFGVLFLSRDRKPRPTVRTISPPIDVEEGAITVLAIDDDPVFLGTISQMLRIDGIKVLTATNPAKGLDMLQYVGKEVDVVLLDYNMPVLNGEGTLEHMRKISPEIKVIATTGMELQSLPVSFREAVDDFLGKPFTSGDLIGCIMDLVKHGNQGRLTSSAA